MTVLRDSSTTLVRELQNTNLGQGLNDLSVDGAGSVSVSVRSKTSVDGTTVQLVQLADTDLLSQVDVTGNGRGSLVEPSLRLLGGQLIASRGLDNVNVTRDLQLTLSLQELGVSVDEILSGNVSKSG